MRDKSEITKFFIDFRESGKKSDKEFFPVICDELKNLAHSKLRKEYVEITFTETGLVHEIYLKMIDQTMIEAKNNRCFLAIAARCMRQILVDHARKKRRF